MAHAPPAATEFVRPLIDGRPEARGAFMEALGELEDRTRDLLRGILAMRAAAADGATQPAIAAVMLLWGRWRMDAEGPRSSAYTGALGRVGTALGAWKSAAREATLLCEQCREVPAEFAYCPDGLVGHSSRVPPNAYCRPCLLDVAEPEHVAHLRAVSS